LGFGAKPRETNLVPSGAAKQCATRNGWQNFCRTALGNHVRRSNLLPDFFDECLRTLAVTGLVVDDLADQLGLLVARAPGAVAHFGGELGPLERRWPLDLCDFVRLFLGLVVRGFRLGHIMEAGGLESSSGAMTARASRGEPKRVRDATVPSADTVGLVDAVGSRQSRARRLIIHRWMLRDCGRTRRRIFVPGPHPPPWTGLAARRQSLSEALHVPDLFARFRIHDIRRLANLRRTWQHGPRLRR
jgi:hypothetical protein